MFGPEWGRPVEDDDDQGFKATAICTRLSVCDLVVEHNGPLCAEVDLSVINRYSY